MTRLAGLFAAGAFLGRMPAGRAGFHGL